MGTRDSSYSALARADQAEDAVCLGSDRGAVVRFLWYGMRFPAQGPHGPEDLGFVGLAPEP